MTNTNHPWCRDPARDEAIRAAEDDAASWRRLEVGEVVQEGDEYQCQGMNVWESVPKLCVGRPIDSGHLPHRRRRVPPPEHRDLPQAVAELRERVAALEAVTNPLPATGSGSVTPTDGLRTDMVTLEVTHHYAEPLASWLLGALDSVLNGPGESVFVMDSSHEITRLAAERDAALRERDAALARVAELEGAAKPAPAANAGGEDKQEPVAWGVNWGDHLGGEDSFSTAHVYRKREWAKTVASTEPEATLVPLYAAPQPPSGWLTEEERGTLKDAADAAESWGRPSPSAKVIRALLARSTPPRVKAPASAWEASSRDAEWIAAIRAAGGEVE